MTRNDAALPGAGVGDDFVDADGVEGVGDHRRRGLGREAPAARLGSDDPADLDLVLVDAGDARAGDVQIDRGDGLARLLQDGGPGPEAVDTPVLLGKREVLFRRDPEPDRRVRVGRLGPAQDQAVRLHRRV